MWYAHAYAGLLCSPALDSPWDARAASRQKRITSEKRSRKCNCRTNAICDGLVRQTLCRRCLTRAPPLMSQMLS